MRRKLQTHFTAENSHGSLPSPRSLPALARTHSIASSANQP